MLLVYYSIEFKLEDFNVNIYEKGVEKEVRFGKEINEGKNKNFI